MDSGVSLLALANGIVVAILDGQYDRENDGNVNKELGNSIAIKHPNNDDSYIGTTGKSGSIVAKKRSYLLTKKPFKDFIHSFKCVNLDTSRCIGNFIILRKHNIFKTYFFGLIYSLFYPLHWPYFAT